MLAQNWRKERDSTPGSFHFNGFQVCSSNILRGYSKKRTVTTDHKNHCYSVLFIIEKKGCPHREVKATLSFL